MENAIKDMARSLGFTACGIAKAAPVRDAMQGCFRKWVAEGRHGDMGYMERNMEKRLDPTQLVEGCQSLIVVAMNYFPPAEISEDEYQIAYYAYGHDYHDVLRTRLASLLAWLNEQRGLDNTKATNLAHAQRIFVDTAPLLERYWAEQAGLGWTGRNHQLIIPEAGSYFLLGVLTTDHVLHPDTPMENRCGDCHRCLEACPTGALDKEGSFDARRCLSYLTIEQQSAIPSDVYDAIGHRIYGCDTCQKSCPWNRFAQPTTEKTFHPSDKLLQMTRPAWQSLTPEQFEALFAGTAIHRIGYQALCRNIHAAKGNED